MMSLPSLISGRRLPLLLSLAILPGLASAQQVLAWGSNGNGQTNVPASANSGVSAISAGGFHSTALKNGGVLAWGLNGSGQATVPVAAQSGVDAISAGRTHSLALKNGGVLAWGRNSDGQCNVPSGATSDVIQIAGGQYHSLALKSDGTILGWGNNDSGQLTVPVAAQSGVAAIAAGYSHTLALKNDGSVVAWGSNTWGERNVPASVSSGVTAIAAGFYHSLALKNGGVIAWGYNHQGQSTVPAAAQSGVVAIAACRFHSLALKSDGSVVAWGLNDEGQTTVPAAANSGVVGISAGYAHSMALRAQAWVTLDQSEIYGGFAAQGTVHLANPAGAGGVWVDVVSTDPDIHMPSSVLVAAGESTATFPITTDYTLVDHSGTVKSSYGGTATVATKLKVLKSASVSLTFSRSSYVLGSTLPLKLTVGLSAVSSTATTLQLAGTSGLGVPASATIPAGQSSVVVKLAPNGSLELGTAEVTASSGASIVASSSVPVVPLQASLIFVPASVRAGSTTTGKVVLNAPAKDAQEVSLSSEDTSISFPAKVTVPAGSSQATFTVTVDPDATMHRAPMTATLNDISNDSSFKVMANGLASLVFDMNPIHGGNDLMATVSIQGPSPVDTLVFLSSSGWQAGVPENVTILAGETSATFMIRTSSVLKDKAVKITAQKGDSVIKKILTVAGP